MIIIIVNLVLHFVALWLFSLQDTELKCPSGDGARPNDVTSGLDVTTSSTPEAEMGSSLKGAARAKRKSGGAMRHSALSDAGTATEGVPSCYGNRMDKQDEDLKSSSSAEVTSLSELELAAAAGRTGKLDDVKARLTH